MGAMGGLLGTSGGQGGTGFATNAGTNAGQVGTAYAGAQNSMASQDSLLAALKAQNGLGNQSQVYNQFQGIANGQGPNPAQAMLNQATGQNVANQAALMAGQRGAGANVGLMARQNAMQGANIQQQAVGQGATMQANQSLNALGQAGEMANTMATNQIGQTNQNVTNQQNEQNILQGANSAQNTNQTALANTTMQGQQGLIGGLLNSAGGAAKMLAGGGQVTGYSSGGSVPQSKFGQALLGPVNYQSFTGGGPNAGAEALGNSMKSKPSSSSNPMAGATNITPMANATEAVGPMTMAASQGGVVPAKVSPKEKVLDPKEAKAVADGKASPMAVGKTVPGQAKVKGDSYQNDTVSAELPVGGVVLPRSVMQSKNPEKSAAEFVRAHLNKRGLK